ncbi:hypothetical protein FB45DRAFT_1040188 [Roridomyces roridus]|uniref:F-box domain-containing protein n=1 Tax=Roridomyces roridus TaxID=1738132 RepID=A0AAD7B1Y6_9AGAR|nr:hypothetical protein FB45DRAFT_1040188 [Roridomyces roridus]
MSIIDSPHEISHLSSPLLETELQRLANAPLRTLSEVCSCWHEMTMNSPTLWTQVDVHRIVEHKLEAAIRMLQDLLARYHDAPLFIQLTTVDDECVP